MKKDTGYIYHCARYVEQDADQYRIATMKKHEVMATKPKVLDGRQREAFFERGYLVINEFLDQK